MLLRWDLAIPTAAPSSPRGVAASPQGAIANSSVSENSIHGLPLVPVSVSPNSVKVLIPSDERPLPTLVLSGEIPLQRRACPPARRRTGQCDRRILGRVPQTPISQRSGHFRRGGPPTLSDAEVPNQDTPVRSIRLNDLDRKSQIVVIGRSCSVAADLSFDRSADCCASNGGLTNRCTATN